MFWEKISGFQKPENFPGILQAGTNCTELLAYWFLKESAVEKGARSSLILGYCITQKKYVLVSKKVINICKE